MSCSSNGVPFVSARVLWGKPTYGTRRGAHRPGEMERVKEELVEKAQPGVMPADTAWRFIGKLQSNKANALVKGVPGLVAVEKKLRPGDEQPD